MTIARAIIPGDTHFISRRCTQRQFLLRPRDRDKHNDLVRQVFLYVIAIAAEETGVEMHALIVMSNHWHALLTDPRGMLPHFLAYVHLYVSKILNCEMGRFENFWASEKPSVVTLAEQSDILDKLVYLMANPVAGQLVEKGKDWPGLRRMWQASKSSTTVDRPAIFYSKTSKMPTTTTLTLVRPPALQHLSDADASNDLLRLVRTRECEERKRIKKASGRFMGVTAILRQRLTATPKTYAKKFDISPRVGAKNKEVRVEVLARLKVWCQAYRDAYKAWRAGKRDVVFPYGTYALRRFAGVCCAGRPEG